MITAPNPSLALPMILERVFHQGGEQHSRNGGTRELLMQQIHLSDTTHPYTITPGRKASLPAQIAETMWVLSGRDDIEWLTHYLPQAPRFSDDGKVWAGAYGPRIRQWGGTDQLSHVINMLANDPTSRRAVINLYDPSRDVKGGRDVPCNNWLHFLVRDGRVHLNVATRSNDIMWGWSGINAFEWSVLVQVVAAYTGFQPGSVTFNISSLHLYEHHYTKAQRILDSTVGAGNDLDNVWMEDITALEPGPVFTPRNNRLDDLCDQWFALEARIRSGEEGMDVAVFTFPEPMMRSWLVALLSWWGNRPNLMGCVYPGTDIEQALRLSPAPKQSSAVHTVKVGSITADKIKVGSVNFESLTKVTLSSDDEPPTFTDMLVSLHTDKSKAYGNSWCKHGEKFSILPNIVRKTDRLGVEGGGDSEADTYVDLVVYLLKYEVWLEHGAAVADDTDHMERVIRNAVGGVQGWIPNAASVASWRHGLVRGVERIINRFDTMTRMGRHAHVSRLVPIAMAAAQAAAEREGWTYPQ